jgi:hypothetical protein
MRKIFLSFSLLGLGLIVGCDRGGSAGGPGATAISGKQPIVGRADDTFNLTTSSLSVQQGDATASSIGIKRGTNFAQDVTISFADLPTGVTLEPSTPVLKSDSVDAKFTVKANDDAVIGEYVVKVLGHPATGGDATNTFKLSVAKKDTFTLSVPFWTTGVKQGEAKAFSLSISRDKKFDQDVTVKFDRLPKGITIEPATSVIKNGETEAKFSLKAADDAAVGDFAIQVNGHPTKGADANHEFKFSVAKK